MAKRLTENITSTYLHAANQMRPRTARRRIVAYVESYDDIPFWRSLLEEFEDESRYFHVMLPSATSLAKGKKPVLMNTLHTEELGRSLIACVDSDYDFLLQGKTDVSKKINTNPYIFQTYAYAIENYRCYAGSLHRVCVQATLNDRKLIDFDSFLTAYSRAVYPLFLWSVWFYRKNDTRTFPINAFNSCTRLGNVNLRHPQNALQGVRKQVSHKLQELEKRFPEHIEPVRSLGRALLDLGLTPDTTYLYIQGHHLVENVVLPLLIPVCTVLRREREREISELAGHDRQYRNELSGYRNSQVRVEEVLRRNTGYRRLFLYEWIREDIRRFLDQEK